MRYDCSITTHFVGDERNPVIVADHLLAQASSLVDCAAATPFRPLSGLYPGLHAPVPARYPEALFHLLIKPIAQVFGVVPEGLADVASDFRMVTAPAEDLLPRQRLPHYDLTDPNLIVILHYLAPPGYGGTSFYRHRRTGFEGITEARQPAFEQTLAGEFPDYQPQGYVAGDNPLFERIASFPASFNRAIVYRGNALHSGDILPEPRLSDDPRTGRLTASTLFTFKPKVGHA